MNICLIGFEYESGTSSSGYKIAYIMPILRNKGTRGE